MNTLKVSVVGGGVSALTTAVVLAECGHDVQIHFVSRDDAARRGDGRSTGDAASAFAEQAGHTASGAAAAFWTPFSVGVYQRRWAIDSLARFQAIVHRDARQETGVFNGALKFLFADRDAAEKALSGPLWWTRIPSTRTTSGEPTVVESTAPALSLDGRDLPFAVCARAPVVDMSRYLPYLCRYARECGVDFRGSLQRTSLAEAAEGRQAVVACGGYETPALLRDGDELPMRPLVGQLVAGRLERRVGREDVVKAAVGDASRPAYVVQSADENIAWLGGTLMAVDVQRLFHARLQPCPDEESRIRRQCEQLVGPIAPVLIDGRTVARLGARPYRDRVRVELLRELLPGNALAVANYGHGGAGVTLSWGCAGEVLRIVEQSLGQPAEASDLVDLTRVAAAGANQLL
jgi:D-amino-acid oxidase